MEALRQPADAVAAVGKVAEFESIRALRPTRILSNSATLKRRLVCTAHPTFPPLHSPARTLPQSPLPAARLRRLRLPARVWRGFGRALRALGRGRCGAWLWVG